MLLKGPERKQTFSAELVFTTSARQAWGQILERLTAIKQRPLRLLMPAYVGQNDKEGSGVFDPIRSIGSGVQFYALDARLVPNVAGIEAAIVGGDIDVLLIIHYFGFVQVDLLALRDLCDSAGVVLVEDCAHCCFQHGTEHGVTGHFSFYSLHKFFPTETGGVLRQNAELAGWAESVPSEEMSAACDSAVLAQLLATDISAVNSCRRENYQYLEQALAGVQGITPLWILDPLTVPHNFPVLVSAGRREKLYFYLQEHDLITIALYYRLVDELDERLFATSFGISSSILNLPVHQDTTVADLEPLVGHIEAFLKS
ncbi:MAG: dTDP-4-amino-4,6-dideoxygalactose transaminase [Planctomycetota bacterium]|jgi:dTDP-4-amino-4,6-dideoxygalactose transaminase